MKRVDDLPVISNWTHCVLDASMGVRDGLFTFCPVDLNEAGEIEAVVDGMNWIAADPPGRLKLCAIIHPDGQEAVEQFCEANKAALDALQARTRRSAPRPGGGS